MPAHTTLEDVKPTPPPAPPADDFRPPLALGEHLPEVALRKESMRCPVCFSREIDVLMVPNGKGRHYCLKCSYAGAEEEVRAAYRGIQGKFKWITRRITLEEQQAL